MTFPNKAGSFFRRRETVLAARLILPPLFTAALILICFGMYKIYPFGGRSVSWGDMSQQIVPLLTEYRGLLDGSDPSSLFYSLKTGGGMNMYGVFFYYLASPFTLLAAAVSPGDMYRFAGLLVLIKLTLSALTASMCFTFCKKTGAAETVLLSVMYPFCGFALLYYQILPWLDMMYLFPLLIMALERLRGGKGNGMYIAVLSAGMVVQYYLCAMLAVFVMLYSGICSWFCVSRGSMTKEKRSRLFAFTGRLFSGSLISALLTAVVWLPSFMQLNASAKTETRFTEVISGSSMVPDFATMLPLIMCSAFAAAVLGADIFSKRRRTAGNRIMLTALVLTLIPFLFEPVNKLWHFGNYICFPGRFAFITCFLMLYCCADVLAEKPVFIKSLPSAAAWGSAALAAVILFAKHSRDTRASRLSAMSRYTRTLWGDSNSFRLITGVFLLAVLAYALICAGYRKGAFPRAVFTVLTAVVFIFEAMGNMGVYIGFPAEHNEQGNYERAETLSFAGNIPDGEFYRVKSAWKLYDNNLISAMEYDTIAHYTSLTSSTAAEFFRLLGYSAVGMEISAVGGTRLSDALLSVRYEINGGVSGSAKVYRGEKGYISRLPEYTAPGLLVEKGLADGWETFPEGTDRADVQRILSTFFLGENVCEQYQPEEKTAVKNREGKYVLPAGTVLHYHINVDGGEKTIYFDCSDGMSTHFSESFFGSTEIALNGAKVSIFPSTVNNGAVCIGDVNGDTEVELRLVKSVSVGSFGLFGIDADKLDGLLARVESAGLSENGEGILSGSCTLSEPKTCLVSLPYDKGLRVRVNGKRVPCYKALSGFTAFDLEAGKSDIVISFIPPGFAAGAVISAAGALMLAAYILMWKKRGREIRYGAAVWAVMTAGSAAAAVLIYIMPLIMNIFMK